LGEAQLSRSLVVSQTDMRGALCLFLGRGASVLHEMWVLACAPDCAQEHRWGGETELLGPAVVGADGMFGFVCAAAAAVTAVAMVGAAH
jgi:hypothetical protein